MATLLADIGGTNTRCALSSDTGPVGLTAFRNADYGGLVELLSAYLAGLPADARPDAACLAVAAPIGDGDRVHMTNIDWVFSARQLRRELRLDRLQLFNDFEALAYSLPGLRDSDRLQVGAGEPRAGAPKAVLGPGTGLGVASLIPLDGGWRALPGEGGHVTLPASDDREAELIRAARQRLGHCSAERLISGPGLVLIHELLNGGETLDPAELGRRIDAGDPPANASLDMLFRLLGTVAADVALTIGAFGGVYIGGGIVPRYADRFVASGFRDRFEDKGRYRDYLRKIPTWLITANNPALVGLNDRAAASGP